MKEELFKKAMDYLQSAEAFVAKEVPAFVSELLEFKIVEHLVSGLIPFIVALILIITGIVLIKTIGKEEDGVFIGGLILSTFGGFVFILAIAIESHEFIDAYKAYKAPRVYLMDYVRSETGK